MGGSNPYVDAILAGSGSNSGGLTPNGPVQTAQNGVNKYVDMIAGSGDQGAIGVGAKIAQGGGGHHNWFSSVLSALDLPRAAVVSGVDQLGRALGGQSASFGQWLQGTQQHETAGHMLADLGVQNRGLDSILGVVGDVGLDPLTYLGGMGEVGRLAGVVGHVADAVQTASKASELAGQAADAEEALKAAGLVGGKALASATEDFTAKKAAADAALSEAATKTGNGVITGDTFSRLKTQGLAGLNPDERSVLEEATGKSLKTGIGLRVPGSKLAGAPAHIPLVPGSLTDPITGALRNLVARTGDTQFMRRLEEKFVPLGDLKNDVRSAALSGDGERAAAIQNVLRLQPEAMGVSRATVNEFGPRMAAGLDQVPKDAMQHVAAAMEGDPAAEKAIQAAGGDITDLKQTYSELRQRAADEGVQIGNIENYFPHQLTDAAREAMTSTGGNTNRARRTFEGELGRRYKAGDSFLGQQLETGSVDEMNQIAHDVYGENAFDLFRSDPRQVTAQYVRGLSRRIGEQHLANSLDTLGVTLTGQQARTPEEWQALQGQLSRQLGKAAKGSEQKAAKIGAKADAVGEVTDQAAQGLSPAAGRGPLAKALAGIQTYAENRGIRPEGNGNLSLDQVLSHGGPLRDQLNSIAGEHAATAGGLRMAQEGLKQAGLGQGSDLVHLGETGASEGRLAAPYVKDALTRLHEAQVSPKTSGLLRFYDKALNVWKQYALAMPGKAVRHTIAGPAWYAYIGNVGPTSLREGFSTWRAFQKGGLDAIRDPELRSRVEAFTQQGVGHGHDFHMDTITGPTTRTGKINKAIHNPLSTRGGYFKANQEVQRRAQDYWRFAMFNDAMEKGALAPEAATKVRTIMGDPHNITNFERSTARRAVPFYTFLRQNLPVELGAVATQPGKFVNAYEAPKREVESLSPKQGLVPSYFGDTLGIRLPWHVGGNQTYLSPDLPFARIGSLFAGKNQLESQTSPLIQDAIAYFNNANTFTGQPFSATAKKAPGTWAAIPGLMQLLHAIAPGSVMQTSRAQTEFGQTTPQGQWEITPKAESMLESLVPFLSQARRALPTEPGMTTRGDTSILADLVGQNFRTNDPTQQAGVLYQRQAALKALIETLQNKGELPKYIYGFHQ